MAAVNICSYFIFVSGKGCLQYYIFIIKILDRSYNQISTVDIKLLFLETNITGAILIAVLKNES
jgi:hypothetical protein